MKYIEKEFTIHLKEKITNIEQKLQHVSAFLLQTYTPLFSEKNMELFIEFEKKNNNPFDIGYESLILLEVTDENGDMIDFYQIPIWECKMYFLGLPISVKIPGSKVIGELIDESEQEIELELENHLEEVLSISA
ncbi:hypothetical protein QUF99_15475 [Bacillus sp. DX4.1]|uniref:hypothetical protein n=1 Tax=Bacillus sp. DX4.1 TaxID=3055867 RepID=UPI0025A29D0C|nr:hypothetical protein [Bacillus sp. DX4.1]MDM5188669.1 hypothetical protein [Bacillus sp. DX4.1]